MKLACENVKRLVDSSQGGSVLGSLRHYYYRTNTTNLPTYLIQGGAIHSAHFTIGHSKLEGRFCLTVTCPGTALYQEPESKPILLQT